MTRMVKKKPAKKIVKSKVTVKVTKPAKPEKSTGPAAGARAPVFKLPATVVKEVSSVQLKGKPFVL